jgi:hypothetical protein
MLHAPVACTQVVSSELAAASEQRDAATTELRRTQLQLSSTEQQLRGKAAELEDVRHAYEQLAAEHRRAQAAVAQLEREAAGREGALRSRVEEVAALQEAQRAAQSTINQYIVDMQVGGWLGCMCFVRSASSRACISGTVMSVLPCLVPFLPWLWNMTDMTA